jgi:hypothetical protein
LGNIRCLRRGEAVRAAGWERWDGERSRMGKRLEWRGLVGCAGRAELSWERRMAGRSREGAQILENRIEWKGTSSAIN